MISKNTVANFLKTSNNLRKAYQCFGSTFFRFIGLFVKQDSKMILFNSYGGKKFDDSPKALYEYIKNDKRFVGYKCVWAFHEPQLFHVEGAEVIRTDSFAYFITALKARIWITNSSIERGLRFKKKGTLYLNTWHGTPIKKMGSDKIDGKENNYYPFDIQNAQSKFEAEVFSKAFGISPEKMLIVGLPRNDRLSREKNEDRKKYKRMLNIPENKTVILFAPTFRDYERDEKRNCTFNIPVNMKLWQETLGDHYVVLLRCHYEIAKGLLVNNHDNSFVRNVTDYPVLDDLMLASDMLISDYSSIIFDYSILERPIVLYTYDYDVYNEKRGMYFDVRKELSCYASTENEVLKTVLTMDVDKEKQKVERFRGKYVTAYGNATEKTVDELWRKLQS